jgi:hypothetical protein
MMIDVWSQVRGLFEGTGEHMQEIFLCNLPPSQMRACLLFLLRDSRECTTQFVLAGTQDAVYLHCAEDAVNHVLSGHITGALWVNFAGMPPVGIYIDTEDMLALSYIRGEWSPIAVMALFDLLDRLVGIAPDAIVYLDDRQFSPSEQEQFFRVWRSYADRW